MTKIISVVSGKGGVGKTTVVSNLGAAFNGMGKKVLVIDGNVTGANLGVHLGLPVISPITLNDVLSEKAFVSQAVYKLKEGFSLIPASIGEFEANYGNLGKNIFHLLGDYDVILIDASAGVNEEVEAAIKASDEVLIVTNPEYPAVLGAMNAKKLADSMGKTVIGAIVNKSMREKHEMSSNEIGLFLETPVVATITNHYKVRQAIAYRSPVLNYAPNSKVSLELRNAAYRVIGEEPPKIGVGEKIRSLFDKAILLSFE